MYHPMGDDPLASVDDPVSTRISESLRRRARDRVATLLHRLAYIVTEPDPDAEDAPPDVVGALVVITDAAGVHRVYRTGYTDWGTYSAAAGALRDHLWEERNGRTRDPVAAMEHSRALRAADAAEHQRLLDAKPYVCACGDRFATGNGHRAHAGAILRRARQQEDGLPVARLCHPDGTWRGSVDLAAAQAGGWDLSGWYCPLPPGPEVHALRESPDP